MLTPVTSASGMTETCACSLPAARFQEIREIGSLPELGNVPVPRAQPGLPIAAAVPVAAGGPLGGAFIALGADWGTHLRFHELLQEPFCHPPQKVDILDLRVAQEVEQWHTSIAIPK